MLRRTLVGIAAAVGLLAIGVAAARVTAGSDLAERMLTTFLSLSDRLPTQVSFEQFLIAGLLACVFVTALVIAGAVILALVTRTAVAAARHKQATQERAMQRATDRLKAEVYEEYQRLIKLSGTLTQRLDKRQLIQNLLQAAMQFTSLPHTDSAVALWALDFETDRMRFELGMRCDETFFTAQSFDVSHAPFHQLVSGQRALAALSAQEHASFIAQDKVVRLTPADAVILVPLIIERTVLGCLVIFCHPDIVKQYEQRRAFFDAAWGQLALALAIAIQGELAILDRLTGMVNHAYFLKRLNQEVERSQRYQMPLGLLMIDIDNFKSVNDTLGHPQGDAVLKIVARLIKKDVRVIDLVGRYGGEEFIVMLPETGVESEGAEASSKAVVVAERIRRDVEEEFHYLSQPLSVTVSIGVIVRRSVQDKSMDAREMIRLADEQLYQAKASGKNKSCVYAPAPGA